jgi:DNA-binding NarL/FixJ family response regulator/class 3 adenylate cyclase
VSPLPAGTVTFVLTDVEGSTALVEATGDGYATLLAGIRATLRAALGAHGGHEVDASGDNMLWAFDAAENAAAAAADGQRALAEAEWPGAVRVRVRAGVHTGTPVLTDEGYVGLDVVRVARIADAGHGGQILLSATTAALVGSELRELGSHRFPGLTEPETVFQLLGEGLPRDFPPLRRTVSQLGAGLRVVLADDSALLREGIARLLEESGFDVVAQSGTPEDLLRHVAMHHPDVVVVDVRMPPSFSNEGLVAAAEIRRRWPEVGVLVLSQVVEAGYAAELLSQPEGVGYLLKDRVANVEEFATALRRVSEGGSAFDPSVVAELLGRNRRDDPIDKLTPREREVLELMAEGRSNQAIADAMFVTLRAVEKHVTNVFEKLGLSASPDDHRRVLAVLSLLRA